jgi:hypothetical protein
MIALEAYNHQNIEKQRINHDLEGRTFAGWLVSKMSNVSLTDFHQVVFNSIHDETGSISTTCFIYKA